MALGLTCRRSAAGNYTLVAGYHQGDTSYPTGGYTTFVGTGTQNPAVAPFHSVINQIGHVFFGGVDSAGRLAIYNFSTSVGLYASVGGAEVSAATDVSNSYMPLIFLVR